MTHESIRHRPALLISAPASGQGKTTATAALARHFRQRGLDVRVFKTGPDYLDPMILQQASGNPVYQLDLWMGGEAHCRDLLYRAAGEADLVLVEGVMGLFDGQSSSADIAMAFGLPVLAVIDGSAMAQSFGAIVLGLARYREGLELSGVIANRFGSAGHAEMLRESLPPGITWMGALPREPGLTLPSRHLGLLQADEITDLERRIDQAAAALAELHPPLPPAVAFQPGPGEATPLLLKGVTIAVARDAAFSFLYPANLDCLRRMGAELSFFSPLDAAAIPDCDAVYLPGGYPELHLERLGANQAMKAALQAHHGAGKPLVAECGGMLALLDQLAGPDGVSRHGFALLPGSARLSPRLVNLGMQSVTLDAGELRGHSFHHAETDIPLQPALSTSCQRHNGKPEPVYRVDGLFASFLHLYFPSNPEAAASLFTGG